MVPNGVSKGFGEISVSVIVDKVWQTSFHNFSMRLHTPWRKHRSNNNMEKKKKQQQQQHNG